MLRVSVVEANGEKRGASLEAQLRRRLFRILSWLEETRPTGLVCVRAGEVELGRLAVSKGRLCLAMPVAEEPETPAGSGARAPSDDDGRRALYEVARQAALRGDTLAMALEGALEPRWRQALLAETGASFARLLHAAGAEDPALDLEQARDDYDEQLTLGVVEVFVATLATQFDVPRDIARQALTAIGKEGVALFLARSGATGEQPFPVAQTGFQDLPLRELVDAVRFAREISRPVVQPGIVVDTSLTTFVHAGQTWRSVAGDTRAVLLRTTPERLEEATAWAHLFASSTRPGTTGR